MKKKVVLMILDGWGIGGNKAVSAVDKAHTPFIDSLYKKYKHTTLDASGEAVGLPNDQMGNSEVGHMNLGAGRIVYQDLVRISNSLDKNELVDNLQLKKIIDQSSKNIHLMGLVSDGGVHSHIQHLYGIINTLTQLTSKKIYIHIFTDGRDTDPHSGINFIRDLMKKTENKNINIASVCGRYYSMDRDKRWERIKLAYDAVVHGEGKKTDDLLKSMKESYESGESDEFIKPIIYQQKNIEDEDTVLFFNFRTDRGRQLTEVLTQKDMPTFGMKKLNLNFITLTCYDDSFEKITVLYQKDHLNNTLGEVISRNGLSQIRIAETEKYPHVTFFFSGGRESTFPKENRILVNSPKVATYDLAPEMNAKGITENIIVELNKQSTDFVCLNFANPDMVGHTGDFEAVIKACETVDFYSKEVIETALNNNYTVLLLADHGNAELMKNTDGSPHTAHTTNPVPLIFIDNDFKGNIKHGKLADIAPTILKLLNIPIPNEMTGEILISD